MSKLSRTKGASFERELVKIFREELGVECRRNLTQYQESELGDIEVCTCMVGADQTRRREAEHDTLFNLAI